MAKTKRDRVNFYNKNLTWANEPTFAKTVDARRQVIKKENGGSVFSLAHLPKDVKDILSPDRYMWREAHGRISQNLRKQSAELKKRHNRIQRARDERIIGKEIKLAIKDFNEDVKEMNAYLKQFDYDY